MLKVHLKVHCFSVSMKCFIRTMWQICLLVAMLMMCSVSGRGIDNLGEQAETAASSNDVINRVRRQSTQPVRCGFRPLFTTKRHLENGEFDNDENADQLDKILGGHRVTRGTVPWQVNIINNWEPACSGVILSEFWILTAAECVRRNELQDIRVIVGDHRFMNVDEGEQIIERARIVVHAAYNMTTKVNNLALIKVNKSSDGRGIRFSNYIQPICLPLDGELPAVGTGLEISGWGQTTSTVFSQPNVLKKTVLPVFNHTVCQTNVYTEEQVTSNTLCAGSVYADSIACFGDTGGPAVYVHDGVYVLAGVVSLPSNCEDLYKPILLSSILAYKQWILINIDGYSTGSEKLIPNRTVAASS